MLMLMLILILILILFGGRKELGPLGKVDPFVQQPSDLIRLNQIL
jgi:hypothetical protein